MKGACYFCGEGKRSVRVRVRVRGRRVIEARGGGLLEESVWDRWIEKYFKYVVVVGLGLFGRKKCTKTDFLAISSFLIF